MAELLATIAPSGGDYTSLSACEAGEQQSFSGGGNNGVWEYQGTWSTPDGGAIINGSTTAGDPSLLEIRTDSANRAEVPQNANKATILGELQLRDSCTVTGLQLSANSTGNVLRTIDAENYIIDRCVATESGLARLSATGTTKIINCVWYAGGDPDSNKIVFNVDAASGTVYISNCTVYGAYFTNIDGAINKADASNATVVVRNCVSYHNEPQNDFDGGTNGFDAASDYNASQDATAPGSNSLTTIADPFDNATAFDFHVSGSSPLIGAGVDLSADANTPITTDFDGTTRSSWDIGAFESVSGGSTVSGDGSSNVTITGSGVGSSTAAATGSSSVAVTTSGAGSSIAEAVGSSNVAVSGAGVGAAIFIGDGASAVSVSGAGVGSSTSAASGSSAIEVTGSAVGSSIAEATGTSSITVSGAGVSGGTTSGAGTSSVTVSVSAVGEAVKSAVGSSGVTVAGQAVGTGIVAATGASSVSVSGTAAGSSIATSTGASSAAVSGAGIGSSVAQSVGVSAVTVTVSGSSSVATPPDPPAITSFSKVAGPTVASFAKSATPTVSSWTKAEQQELPLAA